MYIWGNIDIFLSSFPNLDQIEYYLNLLLILDLAFEYHLYVLTITLSCTSTKVIGFEMINFQYRISPKRIFIF